MAQKISARIRGVGVSPSSRASSAVTAARNIMTVMLSMNMDSTAERTIKRMNRGAGLKWTIRASRMHSHRKKPLSAMPSTITIMPAIKSMVSQLMPVVVSTSPREYQKVGEIKLWKLRDSATAAGSRIQSPNTMTRVARPQARVTRWRGNFSSTSSKNITRKIATAAI